MSKRLTEKWYTYAYVGYTFYGHTEFEGDALSEILAIAYNWIVNFSLLAQYLYHDGVIKDFSSLSDPSYEVDLGFKWRLSHGGIVGFGLIVNIIAQDNSPDFGLHLAWACSF
jgi:hypothetical protein